MDFSTPLDDISLAALKKDCRRTQEKVYRMFSPAAWTLAVRLCGCDAQAWDAVQAGFVRAFERAGQVRQADRFGAWLKRIVINQVMDLNRHRFEPLPENDNALETTKPFNHEILDLEKALDRLESMDRTVLWLHDAEGMTHGEIADLVGQTVSWSKSRLSRARARISPTLEDTGHEPVVKVMPR